METNIVEVENFVQQSEERRGSAFTQEVKRYLERYPNTQYVDVLLTDLNGCFRGKRIPVSSLKKLEKGCYFPASVFAMDILGNVVEEAGLGQEMGEPDRSCIPVPGTLTPSAADPQSIAQVQLTMVDEDGAPFDVEPRNVLNRLWQQLRQRGLFPVVAVELEFYLLDRQRDAEGYLQPPCAPGTDDRNTQSQVYSVDNLNHFADVLNDIDELAQLQLIPADGAVAEASPGQFEINLYHTDNVLEACDDALALKRLVRLMAEKHKMHATFMAKPYEEHAGSGMHIHISMLNNKGENVLVDGDEAGKKYAATVRGLLNNDRELERDHLTSLPALDMEHFMYRQGFADVFHRVAQIPENVPMNMRKIISKAIHRSSKPDLAIEVAMEAGRRGVDAVPTLLRKMLSRVLWLARGRAD